MDVLLDLDHPHDVFSSGQTIRGSIFLHCTEKTSVSSIDASLIGEISSVKPGLLRSSINQKKRHYVVRGTQTVLIHNQQGSRSTLTKTTLVPGSHRFYFAIQIPDQTQCTCQPAGPRRPLVVYDSRRSDFDTSHDLPPTMFADGVSVSYRVNVAVTRTRKGIKSVMEKSAEVQIWPSPKRASFVNMTQTLSSGVLALKDVSTLNSGETLQTSLNSRHASSLASDTTALIATSATILPDVSSRLGLKRFVQVRLDVQGPSFIPQDIYLQNFQILLLSHTRTRIKRVERSKTDSSILQTYSSLQYKLFEGSPIRYEKNIVSLDPDYWGTCQLPMDAIPTFTSHNIERQYELEIMMGFACTETGAASLFIPLRVPVVVTSAGCVGNEAQASRCGSVDYSIDCPPPYCE